MNFFEMSFIILAVSLFIMAILMVAIPVQPDKRLDGYKFSRKLLAVSYMLLGIYCLVKWRLEIHLFCIPFICVAHLEMHLIGITYIYLLTPSRITTKRILKNLLPTAIMVITYVICRILVGSVELYSWSELYANIMHPEVICRLLWEVIYVSHMIHYIVVFFIAYQEFKVNYFNSYTDQQISKMSAVRGGFATAMCIGAVTICIPLNTNPKFAIVFNMLFLFFYLSMQLHFMQYPALIPVMGEALEPSKNFAEIETLPSSEDKWEILKKKVMDENLYLKERLTLSGLASSLGIQRNNLSYMINTYEGVNFNTFIASMRIREACRLLQTEPTTSISDIATRVGIPEQSNFTRLFKTVTGLTPSEYRGK